MARINHVSITLCTLLFTALPLMPMAYASKRTRESFATVHITKKADKKKSAAVTKKTQKTAKKAASKNTTKSKTASSVKKSSIAASKDAKARNKHTANRTASANFTGKYTKRKGYKSYCVKVKNAVSGTLADAHKTKVRKATKVVMDRLMQQTGKSYHWGGNPPRTSFDRNGLVYYTYKDLIKIHTPRTADGMYRLHDAAPIKRSGLKSGDLVFSRTQGRDTADHVGAYVGSGKFTQSPRTGREIQITSLSEDYWQHHYVDARRVVAPKTLR